jgi:hypothetical protein
MVGEGRWRVTRNGRNYAFEIWSKGDSDSAQGYMVFGAEGVKEKTPWIPYLDN